MEWNMKTPSQWEWDNLMHFSGKTSEISKQVQPTDWGIEGDGGIDNGSFYSSGGGGCSGSDLGNGSSSKSSASIDSSSKGGTKLSKFNIETVERFAQDLGKKKDLGRVEDNGISPKLGGSIVSGEPLIGLKLGKRTYFEDVCAGSTVKPSSFPPTPKSSTTTPKRSRASYQSTQTPRCQVEGCNLDLTSAKDYHRRHRVCINHSKSPKVVVAGQDRRFCQQCSRFHDLLEFDEKKRSCRRRLADHNARRRKPQPEAIQFNSSRLSSSFYDPRQQMSILFDRVPLAHTRPAANATWETSCDYKPEAKESLMSPAKAGGVQIHLPNNGQPNTTSTLHQDSDRLLSFKGTTADVLNQGLEASVIPSNLDATPDLGRALSLLSNNPWRSGNPEPTSLDQLMRANHTSVAHPAMHAVQQGWPLGSSEYWQTEQQSADSQVHSLASQINSSSQFQEFQLFKAPFESGYYTNQMN